MYIWSPQCFTVGGSASNRGDNLSTWTNERKCQALEIRQPSLVGNLMLPGNCNLLSSN